MEELKDINEAGSGRAGVDFVASAALPTEWGEFTLSGFAEGDHLALTLGDLQGGDLKGSEPPLCRIHSECLTGDALFSLRCDCGSQLRAAMQAIGGEGRGLILYLRQEGRGIGILNKIRAYALQDSGADTVEANVRLGFEPDSRDYRICRPMLDFFGVSKVRLMTNNPHKVEALRSMGVEVSDVVPIRCGSNPHNESYLAAKIAKLGHLE